MKHLTKCLTAPLAFAASFLLFEAPSASASSLDTERLAKSAFAGIYDNDSRCNIYRSKLGMLNMLRKRMREAGFEVYAAALTGPLVLTLLCLIMALKP